MSTKSVLEICKFHKQHDVDALLILVQVELLSGGVNMPVTPLNVYEYVRKYAEHRMLVVAEQPLHVSKTLKKI